MAESSLKDLKFQKVVMFNMIERGMEISNEGVTAVMKIFESAIVQQHFTYNLKVLDIAGQFLQLLVKVEDRARDHNMLERILSKGEAVLTFALKSLGA